MHVIHCLLIAAQATTPSISTPLTLRQSTAMNDKIGRSTPKYEPADANLQKKPFSEIYKPSIVENDEVPTRKDAIFDFNSRKSSTKLVKSSFTDKLFSKIGCEKIDSIAIGSAISGSDVLNGRAFILSCALDTAVATIEVFDYSQPTEPAMVSSLGAKLNYDSFHGGNLTPVYFTAHNNRKFHLYEWIGNQKSISISVIGENSISNVKMRDICFSIIENIVN